VNPIQHRRVDQMVQAALQHGLDAGLGEELARNCVAVLEMDPTYNIRSVCFRMVDQRLAHRSTYKWPKSGVDGIALAEAITKAWEL
jgi:hypothetical protein